MSTKKATIILFLVFVMGLAVFAEAQEKTIVFVTREDEEYFDPTFSDYADFPFIMMLEGEGYTVTKFYNESLSTASEASLDTLNNADLIILGRSTPSTMYQDPEKAYWNLIEAPILNLCLWNVRSSRLNWFNSTAASNIDDEVTYDAFIEVPEDPVFEGIDTSADVPWAVGPVSFLEEVDAGNGIVLARETVNLWVLFVRFEPNVEFYEGSVDMPAGHRTMLGNGNDNLRTDDGAHVFNFYNFTEQSEMVYLAEVKRMLNLGETAVDDRENTVPNDFVLAQNYPNPFNPETIISYTLPQAENVTLAVYDVLGNEITTLVNEHQTSGQHQVSWNGKDADGVNVASGIYVYRVTAGNSVQSHKMLLVK